MLDYRRFKEINDLFASGQTEKARHLLMEMQSRCIALRDEMSMLKIRLQSLEDVLYLAQNLFEEHGFYWLHTSGVRQGPFCPRCYETEGGLIRLEKRKHRLECPYCRAAYDYHPELDAVASSGMKAGAAKILHFAR